MSTPSSRALVKSLRGRVMLTLAVGAALVSLALALSVYTISRGYLTEQRERSAERQAGGDAAFVRARLSLGGQSPPEILEDLDPAGSTAALLLVDGRWYSSQPGIGPDDLPEELRTTRTDPVPATPVTIRGEPFLVAGRPLADGAVFYELAPLRELRAALEVVKRTLIVCGIAATVAAALVGLWASRRLLRPLRQLADTAVRVADGQLDIRVPKARDVELAMIGDSVNRMVDSLQQRIERERRVFGDVSHELRTPLTTLVTAVGVLRRHRDSLSARTGQAFDLVDTEVNHLRRLLDHLLALARAEAGLHQDQVEELSVGDLLTHVLVDSGRPADLLTVDGDSTINGRKLSMERAFLNLCDNADRHGGGLTGVIVRRDGAEVVVMVDDAGPGVRAEDRERVFERFATGCTDRSPTSGTGLGLALVAETVAAHGGRVRFTDRPGGGARVVITLPAATTAPTAANAAR